MASSNQCEPLPDLNVRWRPTKPTDLNGDTKVAHIGAEELAVDLSVKNARCPPNILKGGLSAVTAASFRVVKEKRSCSLTSVGWRLGLSGRSKALFVRNCLKRLAKASISHIVPLDYP